MNSRKLFTYWFGIGAPVYFLIALGLAFVIHIYLGIVLLLLYSWRVYDSFHTTCSRCGFYGTYNCGLQGKIVSLMLSKKSGFVSRKRIKIHFYTDIFFIVLTYLIYLSLGIVPALLAAIWPVGAWIIALGPKKYHGLMWRI